MSDFELVFDDENQTPEMESNQGFSLEFDENQPDFMKVKRDAIENARDPIGTLTMVAKNVLGSVSSSSFSDSAEGVGNAVYNVVGGMVKNADTIGQYAKELPKTIMATGFKLGEKARNIKGVIDEKLETSELYEFQNDKVSDLVPELAKGFGSEVAVTTPKMMSDMAHWVGTNMKDPSGKKSNALSDAFLGLSDVMKNISDYMGEVDLLKSNATVLPDGSLSYGQIGNVLGHGVGQGASMAVMAGTLGPKAAYGFYALAGGADVFKQSYEKEGDIGKANTLATINAASTYMIDRWFDPLPENIATGARMTAKQVVKEVGKSAIKEPLAEGAQQIFAENLVRKIGLDAEQDLFEGVAESMIGAFGGAAAMGGVSAASAYSAERHYQEAKEKAVELGATEGEVEQYRRATLAKLQQHPEAFDTVFQQNVQKTIQEIDTFVKENGSPEEVRKAMQTKADLEEVYNRVYEQIKTKDNDKVASAQAKVVQGVALWGAQELGISPLEYFEQRFPRIERIAYREFAQKINKAKRAGEKVEINLYEALKNPKLLRGHRKKDNRLSLTQFLRNKGGLIDTGGDLKAMDADKSVRGLINNKKGNNLDDATLSAWEAGYFPQFAERPTINDLLDAIDKELRGDKIYASEKEYSLQDEVDALEEELDRIEIDWRNMEPKEIEMAVDAYLERQRAYRESMEEEDTGENGLAWFQGGEDAFKPSRIEKNNYISDLRSAEQSAEGEHRIIRLGDLPVVYRAIGIPQAKVNTDKKTVIKDTIDKHAVSMDVVESLPDLYADPIMIFAALDSSTNKNSFVAVLDAVDKNGKQMIAALSPTRVEGGYHMITSFYGRNNLDKMISTAFAENKVKYVKDKKNSLLTGHNAYLSQANNSILQKSDLVNRTFYQGGEERNLVAVHSISASNLEKAIDLGGFPVPSIAIIKKDQEFHFDNQPITLVGNKDLINPKNRKNEVYDRDIWSATFPHPSHKKANIKDIRKFENEYEEIFAEVNANNQLSSIVSTMQRQDPTYAINEFIDSDGAKAKYIKDVLGKKLEIPMKDRGQEVIENSFMRLKPDDQFFEDVKNVDKYPSLEENKNILAPAIDALISRMDLDSDRKAGLKEVYIEEDGVPRHIADRIMYGVYKYNEVKGKLTSDVYETKEYLNSQIENPEEYAKWAEKEVEDKVIGEKFIEVGKSLKPITLENIVLSMTKKQTKNSQNSLVFGTGKVIAGGAKRLNSIKEIKIASEKLVSKEVSGEKVKQLSEDLMAFGDNFAVGGDMLSQSFRREAVFKALASVAGKENPTKSDLSSALNYEIGNKEQYSDDVLEAGINLINSIRNLSRYYFEAKPQRAVGLTEFSGAIIPTDARFDEIAQKVQDNGLKVVRSDNQVEAMKQFEDVLFQDKDNKLYRDPKGAFSKRINHRALISMFERADASTFMHETAHFFFEELKAFAKTSKKSAEMLNTINEWLGYDGVAYTEAQIEQFARGFEQYLREGKAPSNYLKRVFDAFMSWMRNLYKTARELDVQLNDDVRAVYANILGGTELDKYMDATPAEVLGNSKKYWKAKREAMDDIYAQNNQAKKAERRLFGKAGQSVQKVYDGMRDYLSDAIVPLEEEIKQISPDLYNMNRRLEISKLQKTSAYYRRIKGFVEGMNKMNEADFHTFDLALKNRDVDTVQRLLAKYDLEQGFVEVRSILDDLREQMIDVGVDVAYMPDYFPRKIKDADGLLDYVEQEFGDREEYSIIQKMLEEKRKDGRVRTKEDEAQIVNSLIRGYAGGISIAKIGNVKERSIDVVDQYMNRYYKVSTDALVDYISGAVQMIENKKYFGRETKELQNLRRMVANRETTIAEYEQMEPQEAKWKEIKTRNYKIGAVEAQIRNTYDNDVKAELTDRKTRLEAEVEYLKDRRAEQVKDIAITRMKVELAQVKKEVDALADSKIENSVGNLLFELAEQGKIGHSQELRLKELLLARFSNKGLGNEFLRIIRDGGYIWTLGNFESAITQFGDLGTSAYKNGLWNTAFEYAKAWAGKSEITIDDLGLGKIIQDGGYADTSAWSQALDKVLKYTGFEKMDKIAKQTLVNSAIRKAREQAAKDDPRLEEYLRHEFGEKWVDVKEDMKTGAITDEILEYAMFQLLDVQPITIDQMPRYYAEGGKKRLFYMMKSYFIKQLNEYRKICFETAKTDPRKAVVDMLRLTAYLMLFNAGADLLKDLLFGRPINVADTLVDNIFIGGSINRYQAMSVKREGLFRTLQKQLLFPVMMDEVIVDALSDKEIKDWNTWKNIPLVGRPYYWWFGGGHLKTEKEIKKQRNQRRNQRRRRKED